MKYCIASLSLFILFSITACNSKLKPQSPVFKRIQNVRVLEANIKNIRLKAEAVIFNPNAVGATVQSIDVDVIANGLDMGKVSQEVETQVKANEEFIIPLVANIPPKRLFQKGSGALGGLLSAFTNKKIDIEYKGTIRVKILGIGRNVPVNHSETVVIK